MEVLWSTLGSDIGSLLLYCTGWVVTKFHSDSREEKMNSYHLTRVCARSMCHIVGSMCGMRYILVAIFGKCNLSQPYNNSNHWMGWVHYFSSRDQWRKATTITVSLPTPLMEMEAPFFTFVVGAAILTSCDPNDYNWLHQSYALDPSKVYQSHSHRFHFGLAVLLN